MFLLLLVSLFVGKAQSATAGADLLGDHSTCLEFDSGAGWTAQPGWLGNPSAHPSLTLEAGIGCFAVQEPRHGMKWVHRLAGVSLAETPYLVLRYRAENYNPDTEGYFLYVDDQAHQGEVHALNPADVKADGGWHVVAVDLQSLAHGDSLSAVAIQVQATDRGPGRVWIDYLRFVAEPPPEARLHSGKGPAPRSYGFSLAQSSWAAQPTWLSTPAADFRSTTTDKGVLFESRQTHAGMKWLWKLPETVTLTGYRYLVLRYRATNVSPRGDYAVAVLGDLRDGGMNYTAAVSPGQWETDGRWHTAVVNIQQVTRQFAAITALAVQVLAEEVTPARLELASVRLTAAPPRVPLGDYLDWRTAPFPQGFVSIPLEERCNLSLDAMLTALRLEGALPDGRGVVAGIPFTLPPPPKQLAATSLNGMEDLVLPVDHAGAEAYLLAFTLFRGSEEPSRGGGQLKVIRDVDRFRVRITYADGETDECLPTDVTTGRREVRRGPRVLRVALHPHRKVQRLTLVDTTRHGAFAVGALTLRTKPANRSEPVQQVGVPCREEAPLPQVEPLTLTRGGEILRARNGHAEFVVRLRPRLQLVQVRHLDTGSRYISGQPRDLFSFTVDGRRIPPEAIHPDRSASPAAGTLRQSYRMGSTGLRFHVQLESGNGSELRLKYAVTNSASTPRTLVLVGPSLAGFVLGPRPAGDWYFVQNRSIRLDDQPTQIRVRHSGACPVQFVVAFNPVSDDGLYLRTEDTVGDCRNYRVAKTKTGMSLGVDYPVRTLAPGKTCPFAPAILGVSSGDWRPAFHAYRSWLKTWYRPAAPRKQWFREVFNFRQRFLYQWDPLFDRSTNRLRLLTAVEDGKRNFGGIDYLHLFDWGSVPKYGRVYGRVGDYSPFDLMPWKKKDLRRHIAAVQAAGVPVGLYIEGYLLQEKGRLGRGRGKAWQLIGAQGRPLYWPASTEMFICPWVREWQQVQARTYADMARDLGVNGMYLDEFGFAGSGKDCYSPNHGHPVPGYSVLGERDCTRRVRLALNAVDSQVALYSEETPCDVTSQYQDGSFTYVMRHSLLQHARVPLNLFRFAVPSFKNFQILICDRPTGTWATGVKWTFFNGDGLWLEGVAEDWFASQTLATIRKCHSVLRAHRAAFIGPDPEPLLPTLVPGVYANRFASADEVVYTLYNSRLETVRGNILRLPARPNVTYLDAWNQRPIAPVRQGHKVLLPLTLGPQDVGCVVVHTAAAIPTRRDGG